MKVAVQLARTIREVQVVVVEVESLESLDDAKLGEIYEAAEGDPYDGLWTMDDSWGCEEGTHDVIGPTADKPDWFKNHPIVRLPDAVE